MDKRCAVEITQVANGFVVYPALRDQNECRMIASAMVFDTTARLGDWLAVHFAREDDARRQQAMAEEQERLAQAMRAIDDSNGGYSASWLKGGER